MNQLQSPPISFCEDICWECTYMLDMIGDECSHCIYCNSGCTGLTFEDKAFHHLLRDVSNALGANASIFDIPKLYNPSIPAASTESVLLPVYTLCKIEQMTSLLVPNMKMLMHGDLDDCSELWNDFIMNNTKKNPYMIPEDKVLSACSHGIGKVAGYVNIYNIYNIKTYLVIHGIRIELQGLLFIMKFVYHYANMADVEGLYQLVKQANLNIPMKPLEQVLATADLGQPLAISDYLKGLNPLDKLGNNVNNNKNSNVTTDFRPVLTDLGLCSSYNAMSEQDVFHDSAIRDFHEVFLNHEGNGINLESAVIREYSFIIDTQSRRDYQFGASHGSHFARYTPSYRHRLLKKMSINFFLF